MKENPVSAFLKMIWGLFFRYRAAILVVALLILLALAVFKSDLLYIANILTVFGYAFSVYINETNRSQDQKISEARNRLISLIDIINTGPIEALQAWHDWLEVTEYRLLLNNNGYISERYGWLVKKLREKIPYMLFIAGREIDYWRRTESENSSQSVKSKSKGLKILEFCSNLLADRTLIELVPGEDQEKFSHWLKIIREGFLEAETWRGGAVVEAAFSLWELYQPHVNELIVQILLCADRNTQLGSICDKFLENRYSPLLNDARIHSFVRDELKDRKNEFLYVHPWKTPRPHHKHIIQDQMRKWLSVNKFKIPLVTIPYERDILIHVTPFPGNLTPALKELQPILFYSANQDDLLLGINSVSYWEQCGNCAFPIQYRLIKSKLNSAIDSNNPYHSDLLKSIAATWVNFLEKNPEFFFNLAADQQEQLHLLFTHCHDDVDLLIRQLAQSPDDSSGNMLLNHLKQNVKTRTVTTDFNPSEVVDFLYLRPNGFETTRLIILFEHKMQEEEIQKYIELLVSDFSFPNDLGYQLIFFSPCPVNQKGIKTIHLEWSVDDLYDALKSRMLFAQMDEESILRGISSTNYQNPPTPIDFNFLFDPTFLSRFLNGTSPSQALIANANGSLARLLNSVHQVIQNHIIGSDYVSNSLTERDFLPVCQIDLTPESLS